MREKKEAFTSSFFHHYYWSSYYFVFTLSLQDGLVKSNMEKLTFYASSSPEKLDRIGEYLAQKTARDLARHRMEYVYIIR